ncbi:MAG: hypothetical protein ACLSUW_03970 [Akkermansia sp.]
MSVFFGGSAGMNVFRLICWLVWKDANSLVDKVGKNIHRYPDFLGDLLIAACLSCLI